jgi:DNA-binding winged helix-turn-helix (wHTH) protein
MRYQFGEFVLDSDTHQLLRADREVPVGAKAFELLELLLRSRPKALSRTRLHMALWPDSHVGPTSLHVLVSQVRAALGDDAEDPVWIRTISRFGYAFGGPASEKGSAAHEGTARKPVDVLLGRPRLVSDERSFVLEPGESVLGREKGLAVTVEAPGVSRRHARILLKDGQATLADLGSKNGTFVGDERVQSPRTLLDGDVIRLGKRVKLVFEQGSDTETEGP